MPSAADTTQDAVKLMTSQDTVKNQELQVQIEGHLRNVVEMMLEKVPWNLTNSAIEERRFGIP